MNATKEASYRSIVKSSSVVGGAAGLSLLLGMVRIKFAAALIGVAGVGLMAGFTAIQSVVATVFGLGIQSSAVREIAAAAGQGDDRAIGRAVVALRRVCWLTGLGGMLAMAAFSGSLSQYTFGSGEYRLDIAALGLAILLGNLSGGQMALLQGMRRIEDTAKANAVGALMATLVAVAFYSWLGLRGIVPSLVVISAAQLALLRYLARRVPVPKVVLSWNETFSEARSMVRLGLAFMWNGLLSSAVGYFTIILVNGQIGVHGVGLYNAAFALSGMFVSFVLNAMTADYYPRLTAAATDKSAVNRLANEQTEIGLLLALPGLLATLALAPWAIRLFYSSEFLPAVDLLQWFVLGCLGRVISWPLGFLILALGKGRWYFATETAANLTHLAFVAIGLALVGIKGVAAAFFALYIVYTVGVLSVTHRLTGFVWTKKSMQMVAATSGTLVCTFAATNALPLWPATILGGALSVAGALSSLRGIVRRIGMNKKWTRIVGRHRLIRVICGLGPQVAST